MQLQLKDRQNLPDMYQHLLPQTCKNVVIISVRVRSPGVPYWGVKEQLIGATQQKYWHLWLEEKKEKLVTFLKGILYGRTKEGLVSLNTGATLFGTQPWPLEIEHE